MEMEIGGFIGNLKKASLAFQDAAQEAVRDVCEYILAESIQIVPFMDGDLQDSGEVRDIRGAGGAVSCAVFYDTPYAVVQHEDMTFMHQPGRHAKYLETPMNAAAKGPAQKIISRRMMGSS